MTRWKAASIHLTISVLVIASVAAAVVLLWYPLALLHLSGVDRLIGLIACVDVVVGPLLTLLVYRHGKPGLRFDLSLIAAIQIGLLGYGLHVLAQNRPVYLVGVVDRLELVTAKDLAAADLAAASPEYQQLSWTGARLVGAPLPMDMDIRMQLLQDAAENRDIHVQSKYYTPFADAQGELMLHAQPLTDLLALATAAEQDALIAAAGDTAATDLRYLVVHTGNGDALVLVDRSGKLGDFAGVDPRAIAQRATSDP